jgi:uncharacterized membrane protein
MEVAGKQRKYTEKDGVMYCDRRGCPGSTGLRCQRTSVPICSKCAVRTPVGYISKDAARLQANRYYNIEVVDYLIAAVIAFVATLVAGFMLVTIFGGFWFIGLLVSAPLGGGIGELVWRSIRFRRGRYTSRVVGGAMLLATGILFAFGGSIVGLIFGVIATTTAVSRFQVALG